MMGGIEFRKGYLWQKERKVQNAAPTGGLLRCEWLKWHVHFKQFIDTCTEDV
jgi:hypothetical protein